jgi:hypothetical protein
VFLRLEDGDRTIIIDKIQKYRFISEKMYIYSLYYTKNIYNIKFFMIVIIYNIVEDDFEKN